MRSRAVLLQGVCLLAVLTSLALAPAAFAVTQTAADPSDSPAGGASGRTDLRSVAWDVGPASATLTVGIDESTFGVGPQRADVAIHVLLDTDADGIADRDITALRDADGVRIDVGLRVLMGTLSSADCQDLAGFAAGAAAAVATTVAGGLETFAFSFDPSTLPGGLSAFRWAAFGQAPPDPAAGGPWDVMPDASDPAPGAPNPGSRRCDATLGGVAVRMSAGIAFPDPVAVPPAPDPQPPAEPAPPAPVTPPAPAPPPAALAASFAGSPRSLAVSTTGHFTFAFGATAGSRGMIGLRSESKVRIGAARRFVRLAPRAFAATAAGRVKASFKLSRADLRHLRRAGRLRFRVSVLLGGATSSTTLTLKAPARA